MPHLRPRMPNTDLTRQLYCFIASYIDTYGLPPTQREMADACFVATGTIQRHLDRLEMLGYVRRMEGITRNIVLGEATPDFDCSAYEPDPDRQPDG